MPIPTKVGSLNTGAGALFVGDSNFLLNGRPAARVGDLYSSHPGTGFKPHPPNPIITGAQSIQVGGRSLGYLGVFEALGHVAIPTDSDIIIGPK
jgi:uncharacterized Zn-binding protein involved in type VI secretion